MKYKVSTFIILLFIIAALISPAHSQVSVGQKAPNFMLVDIDGKTFNQSDCEGRIVLLFFMGYSCGTCKIDAPYVENIKKEWADNGVKVIGIDIWDGTPSILKSQFVIPTGSTYNFLTYGSSVGYIFGMGTSNFVIVGVDGIIKYIGRTLNVNEIASHLATLTSTPGQRPKVFPELFRLEQNFPNPFNPETRIDFELRVNSTTPVELTIYNLLGVKIKTLVNEPKTSGFYSEVWDGTDETGFTVSAGIYIYTLKTSEFTVTKRMLLLK